MTRKSHKSCHEKSMECLIARNEKHMKTGQYITQLEANAVRTFQGNAGIGLLLGKGPAHTL